MQLTVFCVPFIMGTHQLTSMTIPLKGCLFKNFSLIVPWCEKHMIQQASTYDIFDVLLNLS